MTSYKRPKLFDRAEHDRTAPRDSVRIPALCQIGAAPAEEAFVIDLSDDGCKVKVVGMGVTKGERVVLTFGTEAPIAGRLKWIRQASIGVAFETPLGDDLLQRVSAIEAPNNVIPLKRVRFR